MQGVIPSSSISQHVVLTCNTPTITTRTDAGKYDTNLSSGLMYQSPSHLQPVGTTNSSFGSSTCTHICTQCIKQCSHNTTLMLGRKSKMADGKKSKRTRKLLDKKMTGCGHKTVQCFNTKCLHQELFFIKDRKKKKKKMKKKKKKEERKRFFSSSFISVTNEDILCQNEMLNVCVCVCICPIFW